MITLTEAFGAFIMACTADGLRPPTIKWYRAMLKPFVDQFGVARLDMISVLVMRQFVVDLRQSGRSPITVADHLTAMRRFWAFSALEYSIPDPMTKIRSSARPKPTVKAISPDDLRALFLACPDTPIGARDRAILIVLADTGIRAGGLITLTTEDIDFARRRLIVTEKGGRARIVPFTVYTSSLISRWLARRPIKAREKGDRVFCTVTGDPLTYWGLKELFKRLGKRAGVEGRHNPHSLRHFAAREYLRQGGDLATLSTLLGHADVTTTANHYAIFTGDEIASRHDDHSPLKTLFVGKEERL